MARWPGSGWQIDAEFPAKLPLSGSISRQDDLGDSIMTAIAIAPLAKRPVQFTELGRLRVQECERVDALRTGLINCGAAVVEHVAHGLEKVGGWTAAAAGGSPLSVPSSRVRAPPARTARASLPARLGSACSGARHPCLPSATHATSQRLKNRASREWTPV